MHGPGFLSFQEARPWSFTTLPTGGTILNFLRSTEQVHGCWMNVQKKKKKKKRNRQGPLQSPLSVRVWWHLCFTISQLFLSSNAPQCDCVRLNFYTKSTVWVRCIIRGHTISRYRSKWLLQWYYVISYLTSPCITIINHVKSVHTTEPCPLFTLPHGDSPPPYHPPPSLHHLRPEDLNRGGGKHQQQVVHSARILPHHTSTQAPILESRCRECPWATLSHLASGPLAMILVTVYSVFTRHHFPTCGQLPSWC